MGISEIFIKRPVLATLFMATILLFGAFGYRLLPVSVLPDIDFPTIQVSVNLPGADPTTMASSVALPLEKQFSTISDIDSMSSVNSNGTTQITLQFNLDRDIDAAAQDVQAAISSAAKQLPNGLPTPPSYRKVNPADAPIFYLSLTSDTLLYIPWTITPKQLWLSVCQCYRALHRYKFTAHSNMQCGYRLTLLKWQQTT